MQNLRLLTTTTPYATMHIADDDMIHVHWKHVTIRLNVTGLIYLVDFLSGARSQRRRETWFAISGTPDDGYQLWIQDIGLRLTPDDFQQFYHLLADGLTHLRHMGKTDTANHLPDWLKLTVGATPTGCFADN